jgi:hypothetical protein
MATRRLVAELGLERFVTWFPVMPRCELMIGMSLADIGTGEFGFPEFGGGTVYEPIAMGKPLIHYRDDALSRREGLEELPPILNAGSSAAIARALHGFCDDPSAVRDMAGRALRWHEEYLAKACVDSYVELINAKAQGRPLLEVVARFPGRPRSVTPRGDRGSG